MKTLTMLACAALLIGCEDDGGTVQADAANNPSVDAALTNPRVVFETTMGNMVAVIYENEMPITSANFFAYIDAQWFDGTLIHRVEDDWVIQGGGFTTGNQPKTPFAPIANETSPMVTHVHGALSMADAGLDTATSQWFIVDWPPAGTPPQPAQLDGRFAAFGLVVEGQDVLEAITKVPVTTMGPIDVPDTEIVVTSIRRQ